MVKRLIMLSASVVVFALLAGCGAQTRDARPAEQIVAERAEQRWSLLIEGEFGQAYQYLSPGARELESESQYWRRLSQRRVQWVSAEVVSVDCEDNLCEANIRVGYEIARALPGVPRMQAHNRVLERWVFRDGVWYHAES